MNFFFEIWNGLLNKLAQKDADNSVLAELGTVQLSFVHPISYRRNTVGNKIKDLKINMKKKLIELRSYLEIEKLAEKCLKISLSGLLTSHDI